MVDRPRNDVDSPRSLGWAVAGRTAVAFVVIGILVHVVVQNVVLGHFHEALDFHARFVVETIVEPQLTGPATTRGDAAPVLRDLVRLDEQVERLDLVDPQGRVVASSAATASGLPEPTASTAVTVLPLSNGDTAHIVQDRVPSDQAASAFVRRLDILLVGGLLTTWLLVVPLASGLGRRLQERNALLEAQGAELRLLLDREQESVARLEELSSMKDSFLGAVSHELRTPMAVVAGVLETLQVRGGAMPLALREDLMSRGLRSARKLDELLTGLLDLNRAGSGVAQPRPEPVELRPLVTEVAAQLPPCRLEVELAAPTVVADRLQLERVLVNLVGNAVRHALGTDAVEVRSVEVPGAVEITVSDRGPGVPDALKQAVFEPFRQGHLHDSHAPGTGIGLSLVARFVAGHGGCTWVSDRAGGGAIFHVRLPHGSLHTRGDETRQEPVDLVAADDST